jgi:putative peptidoglycan lipid II flippase
MLPGILGAGVYHLNIFADMMIASFLKSGSISYLYYADRLQQLPLGVVGIAVGTALLPMLSRAITSKRYDEAQNHFNRALEACLLFALPAAVALMLAAKPIILGLFNYGAFTHEDAAITSFVLTCYALGLPTYIIAKVFQSACFAQQDTKTPVKISIVAAVCNIIFGITLSQFIGVAGIAIATAISGLVQITLLYRIIRSQDHLKFDARLKRTAAKIAFSCLGMAIILLTYRYFFEHHFQVEGVDRIAYLVGLVGSGAGVYFCSIFLLKAYSISDLRAFFKKK